MTRRSPDQRAGAGEVAQLDAAAYEASLHREDRKQRGIHYTPLELARFLVGRAISRLESPPRRACDPTCGGGIFLLAVAEALAEQGIDPVEIVQERLFGADIDPEALQLTRRVLLGWAEERTGRSCSDLILPGLVQADILAGTADLWGDQVRFDLIVGNPPFLSQLRTRTTRTAGTTAAARDRFGVVGAYADSASLILLGSLGMLADGGVATMIQPQSFLSTRDTSSVRDKLLDSVTLVEVWSSDASFFDAAVRVCAITVRNSRPEDHGELDVVWGGDGEGIHTATQTRVRGPKHSESWGPIFATAVGLPVVERTGGMCFGDIATATAGFRDEFYALVEACIEDLPGGVNAGTAVGKTRPGGGPGSGSGGGSGNPRLITVGMIDPCHLTWGYTPRRLGGVTRLSPELDIEALRSTNSSVHRWATARLVPKVLVATQTRIIEAAVDETGDCVPVTPVISVEPVPGWQARVTAELGSPEHAQVDLWWLVAALSAPSVAADALGRHLGAGLSGGALRLSASSVLELELPAHIHWWELGAEAARKVAASDPPDRRDALAQLGTVMCRAHGQDPDGGLLDWWLNLAAAACLTRGAKIV